jgi:uncharacterized protein YjbI with pentapeptide repeats
MAEEFSERRLRGARFNQVDLSEATFERVTFKNARFQRVDLTGVTIRGAAVRDAEIRGDFASLRLHGDVESLTVNGIEVAPLIEAELERLHPERAKLRPTDAAGFREAWTVIEELWAGTVERASELPPTCSTRA